MTLAIVDLQNFDINLISTQFGSITLRNYGEAGVVASLEPLDPKLYNEKLGGFGDMMVSKNYKGGRNKILRIQMLRNSPDYAKMQAIVAAEEAGQSVLMAINCRDSKTEESYASPSALMQNIPNFQQGSDVDGDVEFTILMANTVHIPPLANMDNVAGV
jgi:hypothetical protein